MTKTHYYILHRLDKENQDSASDTLELYQLSHTHFSNSDKCSLI